MPGERARDVADILVEGDLLGHDTHGLQLLSSYLQQIETGQMKLEGEPITLADHGAVLTWDGQRLPGPWLV
jgi:L-lactate dehydrogenase